MNCKFKITFHGVCFHVENDDDNVITSFVLKESVKNSYEFYKFLDYVHQVASDLAFHMKDCSSYSVEEISWSK